MQLSKLLKIGLDHFIKYGDMNVEISILTEDDDFPFKVDDVYTMNDKFEIEVDVGTKEELMKMIKFI